MSAVPSDREQAIRSVVFVARCAIAAALAYEAARAIGLAFPVWASISALIVSQERLHETRISLYDRIRGTLLGVAISLAVSLATTPFSLSLSMQLMLSVAICAAIARASHGLRVCMWTCPIVLLSGQMLGETVLEAGLSRALEIVIGCLVGAAVHLLAEFLVTRLLPHLQPHRQ
ncbi:FUSC family protein [Stenotrophomonas sp. MMGLT7]|uniref:FUSC family protein n=1 Tax=Stenotrophomonas sp. MMGLT7 TaxID=2901227 RepID=UPI001E309015|nr:FUSC family protein [Stenotrophomonas sp. MMGLT7]MCD7097793.1 FUSC family protein [Stenotrophomonas sp. MMGLT7]